MIDRSCTCSHCVLWRRVFLLGLEIQLSHDPFAAAERERVRLEIEEPEVWALFVELGDLGDRVFARRERRHLRVVN